MRLINLMLNHFKGIEKLSIQLNGGNITVFGDNATGKTTVFDAFNWLLFAKDSQNKQMDDQIKYRDSNGEVNDHGVEHSVEASFDIAGRKTTLKKVFSETWTKKRGSATASFTGHTTDYFIDGVPVKKKEYDSRISEIVDEKVFKLLTNPLYFNEQLHWQDRRKILLEVCGDIADQDVIQSDKKLRKLPEILQGRSIEDHRKVIMSKRSEINKEIEKIPTRIDEVNRGLPQIEGLVSKEALEVEIESIKKQQQDLQNQIVRIENGGQIAEREKALREVESRIIGIMNQQREAQSNQTFQKRSELNDLKSQEQVLQNNIQMDKQRMTDSDTTSHLTHQIEELRKSWFAVNEKQFIFDQSDVCPTCGQKLPEEQIEAAHQKALADFNTNKSMKLEKINADGKKLKIKLEETAGKISDLNKKVVANESKLHLLQEQIKLLQAAIDSSKQAMEVTTNPALEAAKQEKEQILDQIDSLKSQAHTVAEKLRRESELFTQDILARQKKMAAIDQRKAGEKRIAELKAQEEVLAAEYERLEGELFLTEEFIRTKVNMLEERINSKFRFARFKLFNQQINGGMEECCETLGNGVPYSAGLNNAARINVGLDIINTLSDYYQFDAPIFVDNAEAVTELIPTKAQMICLIVSAKDKALRIETEDEIIREAI